MVRSVRSWRHASGLKTMNARTDAGSSAISQKIDMRMKNRRSDMGGSSGDCWRLNYRTIPLSSIGKILRPRKIFRCYILRKVTAYSSVTDLPLALLESEVLRGRVLAHFPVRFRLPAVLLNQREIGAVLSVASEDTGVSKARRKVRIHKCN